VTTNQQGSAVVEFPNDLEVLVTREFQAPIQLVFDVFTKEEHMRKTIAPFGEEVTVCDIDLRVGGDYRYVFVTEDGTECSFRGTFLEIEPPTRMVETWRFDGWPDTEAGETINFYETDRGTKLTWSLVFRDQAGRDHMTKYDGIQGNFDNVEAYLRTLLDAEESASG
jgi:uncharacterized protein YndB with AHSA1/START domain